MGPVLTKVIVAWMDYHLEHLPEETSGMFYILKRKGQPQPRVTRRTCSIPSFEGECRVPIKRYWAVQTVAGKKHGYWKQDYKIVRATPVRDNPWWADRAEDGVPTIDYHESLRIEQENADLRDSLHKVGKHQDAYRVPSMFSMIMEDMACTHLDGDDWVVCPHHTGFKVVEKVLKRTDLSDEEKARRILWFYLRPSRNALFQKLPRPGYNWSENDIALGWAALNNEMMYWYKVKGKTAGKAKAIAHARMHKLHPEFYEFANYRRQVKLPDELSHIIRRNNFLELRRLGFPVSEAEATRAYRALVGRGHLFTNPSKKHADGLDLGEVNVRMVTGKCPVCLDAPQGKFPVQIIRFMPVTQRGWEVLHEDAWVHCGQVDEPASVFKARPLMERKQILGCKCKHCWQEDAYSFERGDKGVKAVVNAEVLLREENTERVITFLADQVALGNAGIEEDKLEELRRSMFYIMPELCEMSELKPEEHADFTAAEEYDDGFEEDYVDARTHRDKVMVNTTAMAEDWRARELCGMVMSYTMDDTQHFAWNRKQYFMAEKALRERLRIKHQVEDKQELVSEAPPLVRQKDHVQPYKGYNAPEAIKARAMFKPEKRKSRGDDEEGLASASDTTTHFPAGWTLSMVLLYKPELYYGHNCVRD